MVKIQPTHTPAGESHKAVLKLAERHRGAPAGGRPADGRGRVWQAVQSGDQRSHWRQTPSRP